MQNNRHSARHPRRLTVRLGQTSSFTVDVCGGGFCTELVRTLPLGSAVEGSILVDGHEITFGGQVAWVKRSDLGGKPRQSIGVRFTRVPWDLQQLLDSPSAG